MQEAGRNSHQDGERQRPFGRSELKIGGASFLGFACDVRGRIVKPGPNGLHKSSGEPKSISQQPRGTKGPARSVEGMRCRNWGERDAAPAARARSSQTANSTFMTLPRIAQEHKLSFEPLVCLLLFGAFRTAFARYRVCARNLYSCKSGRIFFIRLADSERDEN